MSHILAILAHADDEALLCGGLLLAARDAGHKITVVIVTDPRDCNRLADHDANERRTHSRVQAFANVLQDLRADGVFLNLPNRFAEGRSRGHWLLLRELRDNHGELIDIADVVLTHGVDTGHDQHVMTSGAVCELFHRTKPIVCTYRYDAHCHAITHDREAKRQLLAHYRHALHIPDWQPIDEPEWSPWCQGVEHFTADHPKAIAFLESLGATKCQPQLTR